MMFHVCPDICVFGHMEHDPVQISRFWCFLLYILVDTIFNYICHFGLQRTRLYLSPQNTPFWRRQSRHPKDVFSGFVKDMLLQNEKCSQILCLLGYIAYDVHLFNKILNFQRKPENGPARHPILGRSMLEALQGMAQPCWCGWRLAPGWGWCDSTAG